MNNRCEQLIDSYRILCNKRSFFNSNLLNKDNILDFKKSLVVMRVVLLDIKDRIDKNQLKLRNDISCDFGYSYVGVFRNGFAKVKGENLKESICDEEGNLLFEEWFDYFGEEDNGHMVVRKDDKYNLFDVKNRKFIFDDWFSDRCDYLSENIIFGIGPSDNFAVMNNKGDVLIDDLGCIPSRVFDIFFVVERSDGSKNVMDSHGKLLFDDWCVYIATDSDSKIFVSNEKFNVFDINSGRFIFDKWQKFECIQGRVNGDDFVPLEDKRGGINFFDIKNCKLLFKKYLKYDSSDSFVNGFAKVKKNRRSNYIDKNGNLISDVWFDMGDAFNSGYAKVGLNEKFSLLKKDGTIFMNKWFDDISNFKSGFCCVKENDKWMFVDMDCNYIENIELGSFSLFYAGSDYIKIIKNGSTNFVDLKTRKLVFDKDLPYQEVIFDEGLFSTIINGKFIYFDELGRRYFN